MKEIDFLLINPWIYDFSAHDFWLKPYGLLKLAGKLRKAGYKIHYIDLLDPFHPDLPKSPKRKLFGTGHFYKEAIPKPDFFRDVPRRFFRYGLPFSIFLREVSGLRFKGVMLTCTMTYWYPGLFTLIDFFAKYFPKKPLYIGGIYAKLCLKHLENFIETNYPWLRWDIVREDIDTFISKLKETYEPSGKPFSHSYPAFDLQRHIPYVVILTSQGCPFSCPYCASKKLYPYFIQHEPEEIIEEISFWHQRFGVLDFAFYDDALLVNFEKHLAVILEGVLKRGLRVRFHTPNALHARFIDLEVASILKKAGFTTIRLGLERIEDRLDQKVTLEEFEKAIYSLFKAGFNSSNLGAYILFGLPHEDFDLVKRTLWYLEKLKIPPYLAEFSPIPGTPLFELAKETSRYPLQEEPLCHNNTTFPALKNPPWEVIHEIKNLARGIRARFKTLEAS